MFKKIKSLFIKDKIQGLPNAILNNKDKQVYSTSHPNEKEIINEKLEPFEITKESIHEEPEIKIEDEITELTQEEIQDFINEDIDLGKFLVDNPYCLEDNTTGTSLNIDISERDTLFKEAAEIVVKSQQGSSSLIQLKLKIGFNRAGRIIDQLEQFGIIGPFEGSKTRKVNIENIEELNKYLNNLDYNPESVNTELLENNKEYGNVTKRELFDIKYRNAYIDLINSAIEDYKIKKEDEEEKEKIKQKYLERERKKLLREQAKQEMINDGLISIKITTSSEERKISQKVKDLVWNRDQGKCVECGSNEKLEFDHIIPFSKGGSNTYRNIQLLCEKCNREKSNKIG
ncbi:DNA translocase FtsK [Paenimyroides ceti]